ncbi:MAG TPA: hypothetical protein DFR83_06925 [Deltaproteobacteria bacterium]|nr:hypothetical protein [Deltaproteobacteria bacterium]
MTVSIYFDDTLDGIVSTAEPFYNPVVVSLSENTCEEPDADVNLDLFVNGVTPRYNQTYEWGVVVEDANGFASELVVFECITPYENGDPGNGEG